MNSDLLISFGAEVKATLDGKVSGYLVRFGNSNKTDLEGDYFTKDTDFGRDLSEPTSLNLYYHHGLDKTIGKEVIGSGTVKMTEEGLWYEGQIKMSDEYQKMIAKLGYENRLGFSSGAASHLVERKTVNNSNEITRWALAEASLTARPAEPMAYAFVKSISDVKNYYNEEGVFIPMTEEEKMVCPECGMEMNSLECKKCGYKKEVEEEEESYFEDINEELLSLAFYKINEMLISGIYSVLEEDGDKAALYKLLEEYYNVAKGIINNSQIEIVAEIDTLKSFKNKPSDIRDTERRLRDAFNLSRTEAKRIASTVWQSLCDVEAPTEEIKLTDNSEEKKKKAKELLAKVMLDLI